ncbi:MAG: hypothetical protein K2M84_00105, partial [Anaeroplasmataceae bacterium]|nr:hypothetical protein [Anaeroplasmataceae bacterium]
FYDNSQLIFRGNRTSTTGYAIKVSNECFKETFLKKIRNVFDELLKVTYNDFNVKEHKILNNYNSFTKVINAYNYAVQRGITTWIADKSAEQLEHLLMLLEKWSSKTYEGSKVPFAFIVNLRSKEGTFDYANFLEEEYSATFTDGITSIIELDKNLKFLKYHSITKNNTISETDISKTPFRFSQVITKFTKGNNNVAIILLTSGDIILIKNAKIELIKRDGKWINFNKDVFVSVVMTVNKERPNQEKLVTQNLLNSIFYTALDVSFSHHGGLIAVVENTEQLTKPSEFEDIKLNQYDKSKQYGIINYIDNLQDSLPSYMELKTSYSETFNSLNMKKRFDKRKAILSLAGANELNSDISFINLDRKLRSEFVSMDGATILDNKGYVISFGAIIQNDSGSYGGGRGAAAKKLSNFGLAIKISTDGYIEVYINGDIRYRMK